MFNNLKKIKELEQEIKKLKAENLELKFKVFNEGADAKIVIETILKRGIDWYDYRKLDKGAWQNYFADAEMIVRNYTFNNELNHFITDMIKNAALETNNFEQVLNIRTGIITLETFKQRLESIENPNKPVETKEEPFGAI